MSKESRIWKPGQSGNPNGRPKGTGRPFSKLRSLVNKLQAMEETALKNIEAALNHEEIEKQALETSKWVISMIPTVNRAATQEEQLKYAIKKDQEIGEEEKKEGTNDAPAKPRFSVSIPQDDE